MDQDETKLAVVKRDEKGRLLPGSKLAAGVKNPVAARISELKSAMLDAVDPLTMRELTGRLIDLCKADDGKVALAALELLFNRVLGKPREHVELDVTTTTAPTAPTVLDATDLAHLERMRRKLATDQDEAEVIDVTPQGGP